VPVLVPGLSGVVQVAGGSETVLALTSAGTVWAWGLNDEGELGNGASGVDANSAVPLQVPGLTGITQIPEPARRHH
jgi:alpha-tubulin suppressor-like RCC1 family protein